MPANQVSSNNNPTSQGKWFALEELPEYTKLMNQPCIKDLMQIHTGGKEGMADRTSRLQPFCFGLPFWAKPSLTRRRPPIPSRQQPPRQTPASNSTPLPPSKPQLPSQTQPKSPPASATPQLAIQKASTSPSPAQDASQTRSAATQAESQLLSQPLPPSSPPKSPIRSTSPSNQPELLPQESQPLRQTKSPARLQLQTLSPTREMNPIQPASKPTDNQPARDLESKPKPLSSQIDTTSEEETKKAKEEKPRTIPESKLDKQPGKLLESDENSKPASKEQPETTNPESDRLIEGFNTDNSKTKPEIDPQKPQTEAGDEPKERNEAKPSNMASNTAPTCSPRKAGEIIAELRISKPEHSKKQDNVAAISTMTWDSFFDGERAPFEKEIKLRRSRLVQRLGIGERMVNGQPVSMITLAGENIGASMVMGSHTHVHRGFMHPKGNIEASYENPAITATINSNAQSISNSALHDSCCNERDPGVHLNLSSKKVEAAGPRRQAEPLKPQKTAPRITPEQKPSQEPRVRRRCLRALFMESSESDPEKPQKPQRHGCRFCCDEKKKGKADIDATSMANGNARARQAEEGTSRP